MDHPNDVAEIMWYYANYKKGVLPVEGGLLDQPGLLMDMFMVIDGAVATVDYAMDAQRERERKAAEARAARGTGR